MSSKKHSNNSKTRSAIGLLLQDLQFRLFLGAAEGARELDVDLFCFLGDMAKNPDQLLKQSNIAFELADAERLDALALWGASRAGVGNYLDQAEMTRFIQHYAPRPIVNYERKIEGIPVILTDVYQGVREAVRHLIEIHDRHRIALIWGPEGHFETEERVRAYRDTLKEYNLPIDPKLISDPAQWGVDGGVEAIECLLGGSAGNTGRGLIPGKDFDAILTTDCAAAIGALSELHRRGIKVPDDVVMIGFDEREDSHLTSPPLTTIKKPFFEVGKRLVELAVEAASGRIIPENTLIPTQLIIRQSCGCIDPAIIQASLDKTQPSQEKFDIIINTRRANFIAEIVSGMQAAAPTSDPTKIQKMAESFVNEIAGETSGDFTRALYDFLHHEMDAITNEARSESGLAGDRKYRRPLYEHQAFHGSTWQNMISAMQRCMLPHIDGKKRGQADALWNQARISIGAAAQRLQENQAFITEQKEQILREIEASLSTSFDLESLTNTLAENLPQLGIRSCFLSLYEQPQPYEFPQPAPVWSRLILAYTEKGRIIHEKDGIRFPTCKLVPDNLLPQDRQASYLVIPLYFGEEQQGFILLEIGPQAATVYNALKTQIASALHGATLVKRIEERAVRLQAATEVSRAASSILNPDELIQQVVELIRERFNLYYVGLFMLDEGERYALLHAGTGDPGKQMVLQGHRLEVGGNSMIGWCIANQKARIALDVGQEAVRFENPLLPATRSELALPLLARGMAIGAITIQSEREAAFSDSDVTILQSMADQLANAIENTRLILARQQVEDALRESELLYTSLVENMNFNVFRKDVEGRYTYANEAFCKMMNTTLVRLLGKTDHDFSPKEIADKYHSDDLQVIATGKPLEVIEEIVLNEDIETSNSDTDTPHGSDAQSPGVRYIQMLKAPVRNTHGDIIGIQGAFWDISDRRRAEKEIERRAVQLQTVSEISRAASSLLDVNELTQQAVNLIQNRFGLYYVGLFLIDQNGEWTGETGRWAVLRAGTGEAGQKMLSQGHKLEIGGASMIGWCTANISPRITMDTNEVIDENFLRFINPLLPKTRSEMALPLSSRGQVLGALTIQSTQRNAFSNEDITILQSMADQLANAIANASLYEQTQTALKEMESIYHRYLMQGWSEYSQFRSASGYRRNEKGVTPLGSDLLPEVQHALLDPHPTIIKTTDETQPTLVVPIKLRDYPIGAIGLKAKEEQRQWSEEEISLIEILSEQFALAAENIRLLEETQRRAEREHLVSEITTRLRTSNDPQTILQTAAGELRRALNAKNARVMIQSFEQLAMQRSAEEHTADNRGEK
jgi:GAF domain-containing protein/ABC-type sugar transport system substrate-binding protein